MAEKRSDPKNNALTIMSAAAVGYSLIPLLVDLGGLTGSVGLFTGAWAIGYALTNAIASARWAQKIQLAESSDNDSEPHSVSPMTWAQKVQLAVYATRLILRATPLWVYMLVLIASFQWVFFAWATDHVDTAIVTAIFEFWPMLFLLTRSLLKITPEGKLPASTSDMVLTSIAGLSLLLVILSEADPGNRSMSTASLIGLLLAAIALGIAVLDNAGTLTQGERIAAKIGGTRESHTVLVIAVLNTVCRTAAGVLLIAWSLLVEGGNETGGMSIIVLAVFGGFIGVWHGASGLTYWLANQYTDTDTINSLRYATPALALVWLWAFTDLEVANLSMFACGAVGVIAINMVLHLDPEGARGQGQPSNYAGGLGFKALVIALWGAGSIVVLRDDWLPEGMLFWGFGEFWSMIGITVTVFVLLLSFGQSRLADRDREADRLVFSTLAEINSCYDAGIVSSFSRWRLVRLLECIDSTKSIKELGRHYFDFRRRTLTVVAETNSPEEQRRLRHLVRDVEVLVNLRQQGRDVTELSVLALFAGVIMLATLLFRPTGINRALQPWEGFGVEVVSMAVSAAVGFLLFDLLERRLLRDRSLLWKVSRKSQINHSQPNGYRLALLSYAEGRYVTLNRILALGLGTGVVVAFTLLIAYKWAG